jgi:hypothetical protein
MARADELGEGPPPPGGAGPTTFAERRFLVTATAKPDPKVTIETCEEGHHTARYRMRVYRFLLSDGQVVDVTAAPLDSDLRQAVLAKFADGDLTVTIQGVSTL